jgi:hypothetical protein
VSLIVNAARYEAALRFPAYLESVVRNAELWQGMYRTAIVAAESVERLQRSSRDLRLLALSEDWCGDCVSCLPVIARLAEQSGMEFRLLRRDENADFMDAHLTSGTRSIPVVMVLDRDFGELAWWGPRPAPVQRWMRSEGLLLAKPEQSRRKRAWYARDRGRTVVGELCDAVERAARRIAGPG